MSQRLDGLAENALAERVTQLQTALRELKGLQFLGSNSLTLTRNVSGASVDATLHYDYHVIHCVELTWTPADVTSALAGWPHWINWVIRATRGTGAHSYYSESQDRTDPRKLRIYTIGTTSGSSYEEDITFGVYAVGRGSFSSTQLY